MMLNKIEEILKELEQNLAEENVTGNVDGYLTPNAFTKKPMTKSDKAKRKSNVSQGGYSEVAKVYDKYTESIEKLIDEISKI